MELCTGVSFHLLSSKKFKDIGFFIRFLIPLREESASIYSLLALMMSDRLEKYPTKQIMSRYLDELYGMGVGAQTIGYGQSQVLELRTRMIHPYFVQDPDYLEKGIVFLKEMVYRPLLNEECLNEAKRVLLAKLKRMRDDASQYVVSKGLKLAGKNHALGISALGEEGIIQKVTLQDIQQAHAFLLNNSNIDIICCGDLQEEDVKELIWRHFPLQTRNMDTKTYYAIDTNIPFNEVREERDIPQSSIMDVYFTHIDVKHDRYYALRVMNAMLGQYSTSLLFQNIREKHSLCYSVFSSLISFDGALGIMTGTNKKDIAQVLELIAEQIKCLQDGDFDDELLAVSKTMVINSLRAGDDNMNSMAALQYQNDLLQRNYTSDTIISLVERVSREDVVWAACHLEHKATYIVTSKEAEDETDHE